jgi:hypothetical protein
MDQNTQQSLRATDIACKNTASPDTFHVKNQVDLVHLRQRWSVRWQQAPEAMNQYRNQKNEISYGEQRPKIGRWSLNMVADLLLCHTVSNLHQQLDGA